ncbi:MAG: hypothetical protein QM500_02865 [Methylococcales bacterium]
MDGKLYLIIGSTRSGKTHWTMKQLEKFDRAIVWDIKHDLREFKGFIRCTSMQQLIRLLFEHKDKPLRVTYSGNVSDFDMWCKLAYQWANDKKCAIVSDELSDVTTISKAPPAWGQIIRKVLCTGSDVFAITQRPAEIDKTTVGNASIFHVHRMSRAKDRKYIAEEMDISVDMVNSLSDRDYIEKNNITQIVDTFKYKDTG